MIRILILACLLCWSTLAGAADDVPRDRPAQEILAQEILVMLRLPAPHYRPDAYYSAGYRDDAGTAARRRIAAAIARDHGLTILEDWAMPALNVDCYRMAMPAGAASTAEVLEALAHDTRVAWTQSINEFTVQGTSDPLYPVQPAARQWQLTDIHRAATGRKVMVAVIDSGVDTTHPDLDGQIAFRENFVDGRPYASEDHGTGVAGVIAARAGNGIGIEGVAPQARIMALRACWQESATSTRCNSFTLAKAMNFALLNGAQVINLSLSGAPERLLRELIDVACARGVRVVSAVDPARADGGFPASHPGVFAVAMEGRGGGILSAPGRDIPTAAPGGRWVFVTGSSYSAAHISGMLAVLGELRPAMGLSQLRASLVMQEGASGVDLCATVSRLTGTCTCGCHGSDKLRQAQLR